MRGVRSGSVKCEGLVGSTDCSDDSREECTKSWLVAARAEKLESAESRETRREPTNVEEVDIPYRSQVVHSTLLRLIYEWSQVSFRTGTYKMCVYALHACVRVVTEIEWHESGRKGQVRNLDKDLVKCRGMGDCDGYPACTSLSFSLSLATFRFSSSFGGLALDPFSPSGSLRSHDHKPSISLHAGNA